MKSPISVSVNDRFILDESINDQMEKVDWSTVPNVDTRSLGVSFSMWYDANVDLKSSIKQSINHFALMIMTGSLAVFGNIFQFSAASITGGLLTIIIVNFLFSFVEMQLTKRNALAQRDAVLDDVNDLLAKYPLLAHIKHVEPSIFDLDDKTPVQIFDTDAT